MKPNLKLMVLFLVGLMMFGLLAACGGNEPASQETTAEETTKENASTEETSEDTGKEEKEKSFFDGKTLTLIVATKPGGGYDTYARLIAPRIEKYLPGDNTIVVKNVPGAGHIIGANEIYNSDPDGLTFGTFNKGLITNQVVGKEGIKFDLTKMSWLGSPATEPRLFIVSKKSPFDSIEDVLKKDKELIMSSAGIGSSSHTDALVIQEILGLDNMKMITGYSGTEGELAMMRGEIHGQIGSIDSMKGIIESGDAKPILIIGNKPLEEYPDVPLIYDYSNEMVKPLIDLMVSQALISRPYAGPPNIPEDRFAVLQEAFEKALTDPELLEEAKKIGRPIEYLPGAEVLEIIKGATDQPEEVVEKLREIMAEED
jgi:tripartite-type tricarboxylate transporter receptor subunit TctC